VGKLVREHDIDVVALVECEVSTDDMLAALNDGEGDSYCSGMTQLDDVAVFARLGERSFLTVREDPAARLSIRQLMLPSRMDILLAVTHLPSKLYWSGDSQRDLCPQLASEIRRCEERVGHTRTVLVGDLNMNPFESGVVSSVGLHGTMARRVAERKSRTVLGRDYPFFYNPMWGHFGDGLDGPPGTYYNLKAETVCYFWNIFDQVLVRPSLLDAFDNDHLKILDSSGDDSLLTAGGLPNKRVASDHLPIVFGLEL
jgi:hypothetical protein